MAKIAGLVAAFLLISTPFAWAQGPDRATGMLSARAYEALAPGSAVAVVLAQDTDQSQRLKSDIEAALRARGYRVADDAPLVLEFYASEVTGGQAVEKLTGALTQERSDDLRRGEHTTLVPDSKQRVSTGVLSTIGDELFGGKGAATPPTAAAPSPRQVHLSISLDNRPAAARVWQGSASGELRGDDSFAATEALVPFLVKALGQTISGQVFELP